MTHTMTKKMMEALWSLRSECDYEDRMKGGTDNFITVGAIGYRVGEVTINRLLEMGMIIEGPLRFHKGTGYRITDHGRERLR